MTTISLDGLGVVDAKATITDWLAGRGIGEGTVNFRLRDWLFSRQRYWGEPFPIVYDEDGVAHALPESMLPLELPEVEDYSPAHLRPGRRRHPPETPLSRNEDWVNVELDLGDGNGVQALPPRDQHHAQLGGFLLVRDALPGPATTPTRWSTRTSSSTGWARATVSRPAASTCTWAARSTPYCTCCTPASGPRCCTTWATSRPPSRSTSCTTRA